MKGAHWILASSCAAAAFIAACSSASGGGGVASGGSAGSASGGAGGVGGSGGSGGTLASDGGNIDLDGGGGYSPGDTKVIIGPGIGQDAPDHFAGGDDPNAPIQIEYPASGIITPPNMNSIELHFTPTQGQNLFEFTYESPSFRLVEYGACAQQGAGCVHVPDPSFWSELAEVAKGGDKVWYRVRGVTPAGTIGTSPWQTMWVAKEKIIGGIYYWNTSGVIQRYDFGYPLQQAENFLSPLNTGGGICVGCHALSRDGRRMAFGKGIPGLSWFTYDVATRTPSLVGTTPVQGGGASYYAFSSDGQRLLLGSAAKIDVVDLATGQIASNAIPKGTQPDWAPTKNTIVYARTTAGAPGPTVSSGALELVDFTGAAYANFRTLVPFQGQNNYYPAFSPDSNWVLFNRSPGNIDSMSNGSPGQTGSTTAQDGQLWVVDADGGNPIRLHNATGDRWCSWPKWAPGLYTYAGNRTAMFYTYSTDVAFGLKLATGEKVQLWMSALDAGLAEQGQDGSFPAFHLPFQDLAGGNHIAQWVTSVERQPCARNEDCAGGEVCTQGKCYPDVH